MGSRGGAKHRPSFVHARIREETVSIGQPRIESKQSDTSLPLVRVCASTHIANSCTCVQWILHARLQEAVLSRKRRARWMIHYTHARASLKTYFLWMTSSLRLLDLKEVFRQVNSYCSKFPVLEQERYRNLPWNLTDHDSTSPALVWEFLRNSSTDQCRAEF